MRLVPRLFLKTRFIKKGTRMNIPIKVYEEIKNHEELQRIIADLSTTIDWVQDGKGRSTPYQVTTVGASL